ncbi:MAG: helix-turn-helix domain-containing protein [Geminicoccaceae bacterium]
MAKVSYVLDPLHPPTEHDQLADALSEAAITAAAHADPDNPPLSTSELERIAMARSIKKLRAALSLSQEAFAARYGIPVATLRQWELGRRLPDRAALSYLRVIASLPDAVAAALAAA